MSMEITPWKAVLYKSTRGSAKVEIRNESTNWFIVIRYMAQDYDSALATGAWDDQGLFIYSCSRPGTIAPDFALEDRKLKGFVSLSAAGTVRIEDLKREIEKLEYIQTAYDAVVEALHRYFPGVLE